MPVALPIDAVLPELIAVLRHRPAAVIVAPTGAGKTTRVPPALAAAGIGGGKPIVMLEPRRVAARAAARRMAEENGWTVGCEVGYQIRFERRARRDSRILVVTEGILVQMLQADPFLEEVGAVVFDEIHERSLATDLSLAMARRVQREARSDLVLVAMSATLDPGPIAAFLDAPCLESRGRLFPVDIRHLGKSDDRPLADQVASAVRRALEGTGGDVLVFLPGVGEIRRAADALAGLAAERDLAVLPLHGDLPSDQQDAALRPLARRKVVLATNVAETSITVDGVTAVVDSGQVRRLRFDPATGLDRLELGRVSRASADQRAGRAGRQAPGLCLRLWTAWDHAALPARETPEIARVDLAGPALQLLAWGETDLAGFGWFEPPDPAALKSARQLLTRLGAVDAHGVTELGRSMVRVPVHPRLARLLLAAHRTGCGDDAALAAALLSERDPLTRGKCDHATRSDLFDRMEAVEALGPVTGASRFLFQARDQLVRLLANSQSGSPSPAGGEGDGRGGQGVRGGLGEALTRSLLAAFPDRLVRRREAKSPRGVMVGGKGVRLTDASGVVEPELFLALDLDAGGGGEARVRLASGVEPAWLPPEHLTTTEELAFDDERGRVTAWRRTRFLDLVLDEREVPPRDAAEAEDLLAQAAATRLSRAFPGDDPEVDSLLRRVRCLREWMPELDLPAFDEEKLRGLLPALAAGRRTLAELRRAPWLDSLRGALTWSQLTALDREAPERLVVPSGSRIRVQYEPGKAPVLAARIQELFGLADTPRIGGGRVPVLLHLLAPNGRPQQVTHDLKSFWDATYPQVKKELAGRYPKHAWPADPWNAPAERRPKRR